MTRTATSALALAAFLTIAGYSETADAAPKKTELFGPWTVSGSDRDGPYSGTIYITNADPRRVRVNASLRYDTGQSRRWSSNGWYAFGRIYCRYDLANTTGLVHGLTGPPQPMTDPVSCIYTPSPDGLRLEGRQTDSNGLRGTESLRRTPSDLVLRYQIETDPAKQRALALEVGAQNNPKATEAILEAYGLKGTTTDLDPAEIDLQSQLPNAIPFHTALLYAVDSFQNDDTDAESPKALMIEDTLDALGLPYTTPLPAPVHALTQTRIRTNMRDGTLRLLSTTETAENGETTQQNWIFSLYMGNYSDHGHWAVIDRSAQTPTFNYGFN